MTEITFEEMFNVESDTRWANKIIMDSLGKTKYDPKELYKDTGNYMVELSINGFTIEPIDLHEFIKREYQIFMEHWRKRYENIEDEINRRVDERVQIILDKVADTAEELREYK